MVACAVDAAGIQKSVRAAAEGFLGIDGKIDQVNLITFIGKEVTDFTDAVRIVTDLLNDKVGTKIRS
jgi:hypothetical protein